MQQCFGIGVRQKQDLEYTGRQAGSSKGCLKQFGYLRGLRGMFEQHGIARHQCRHNGVYRGKERVVPRCHYQHVAQRLAAQKAFKAGLGGGHYIGERFVGNGQHMARTLFQAAYFAGRLADGAAHAGGDGAGDVVAVRHQPIDGGGHLGFAFGQGRLPPTALCGFGGGHGGVDGGLIGVLAVINHLAVCGRGDAEGLAHGKSLDAFN